MSDQAASWCDVLARPTGPVSISGYQSGRKRTASTAVGTARGRRPSCRADLVPERCRSGRPNESQPSRSACRTGPDRAGGPATPRRPAPPPRRRPRAGDVGQGEAGLALPGPEDRVHRLGQFGGGTLWSTRSAVHPRPTRSTPRLGRLLHQAAQATAGRPSPQPWGRIADAASLGSSTRAQENPVLHIASP